MAGTLYLVATPIGNLGDLSARAIEVLRGAARIIAEDTRRTRILLTRFDIQRPLVSMPAFREGAQADGIVAWLAQGEELALVTDAGSPGISDPGTLLVQRAIAAGAKIVPIPGPAAFVAALTASGLPTDRFFFAGFLPRKGSSRERALAQLSALDVTLVLYESPERLAATLRELAQLLGARRAVVARELTKLHEELVRGTLPSLAEHFAEGARGELVICIAPPEAMSGGEETLALDDDALRELLRERLSASELSVKDLARSMGEELGLPRQRLYALILELRDKNNE